MSDNNESYLVDLLVETLIFLIKVLLLSFMWNKLLIPMFAPLVLPHLTFGQMMIVKIFANLLSPHGEDE